MPDDLCSSLTPQPHRIMRLTRLAACCGVLECAIRLRSYISLPELGLDGWCVAVPRATVTMNSPMSSLLVPHDLQPTKKAASKLACCRVCDPGSGSRCWSSRFISLGMFLSRRHVTQNTDLRHSQSQLTVASLKLPSALCWCDDAEVDAWGSLRAVCAVTWVRSFTKKQKISC